MARLRRYAQRMTNAETHHELMGVLVETARAHHAATGGVNPQWAAWYAARAIDDINRLLTAEMTVTELTTWLEGADRRYTEEEPEESWPRAYATWLLEEPH